MVISVEPVQPSFVAEVRGVDLTRPVSPEAFKEIEGAFDRFAVLIFPDQRVTDTQQVEFSANFGPVFTATNYRDSFRERRLRPEMSDISNIGGDGHLLAEDDERRLHNRANQLWHTDNTFKHVPARCSLLSARELPPAGGETEFADMRAAYDALPEDRKRQIDGLVVEHDIFHSRRKMGFDVFSDAAREELPPVRQVLVRIHPATERKALYIASHAARIIGWPDKEGLALIEELIDFATRPDFLYRHRWRENDLVLWDNRCTMHRARPYEEMRHRRVMHRTTVSDEINTVERLRQAGATAQ
ncbi:MAG: TauD/TfdA family dioxygenase [Pseudomonadota bacterium]